MLSNSNIKKDETSLVTLSRKDLTDVAPVVNDDDDDEDFLPLVLLQMPSSLSMSDLQSSRIVANHDDQQACLVVEQSGKTFAVSRVETSNSLVLLPPPASKNVEHPPASKKLKTSNGNHTKETIQCIPARLVKPGGSGASFLELKFKTLHTKDLIKILMNHVFDPHHHPHDTKHNEWVGCTVPDLAMTLQCSETEIKNALQKIKAFGMPQQQSQSQRPQTTTSSIVIGYGTLSEEAIQETQNAIVATLTECDDFGTDYCTTKGIDQHIFEKEVLQRMEESEADGQLYPQAKYVIQHCTKLLQPEAPKQQQQQATNNDDDNDHVMNETDSLKVHLDFQKIAICVAHRLFQKDSTKSWEESDLMSTWYNDLPGVGNEKPSIDLLAGVAIRSSTNIGMEGTVWNYFPEYQLSLDPKARFDELFMEQERWTEKELTPYLERLTKTNGGGDDISDLMNRYTHVITETIDGTPIKIYMDKSKQ